MVTDWRSSESETARALAVRGTGAELRRLPRARGGRRGGLAARGSLYDLAEPGDSD